MTSDLPQGTTSEDVRGFAMVTALAGTMINLTSAYYDAPEGPESDAAESILHDHVEMIMMLGRDRVSIVMQVLASIIVETGDEATVQAWFEDKAREIAAVLDG